MSNTKLIVVVGITGNQGSSVANSFLHIPGWRIRGITRNPTSTSAETWVSKGVELVQADLDDLNSLERVFSGASAIFAVTNFWSHFFDPANGPKAQKAGVSINEFAYQREITQGMNMALAASSSTVLSTLTHYWAFFSLGIVELHLIDGVMQANNPL
ncbi:Putative NmrA-like domain, NAD(P)-binding domain superfamily [Colletotrichum destructivum]|uniref:NmrA-like domain, NAD(P)-binding domain superfamily n=1 Tax=Colletotrichum destructivum TaxID=34406 RepID=A0AAX4J4K6_9PEZI|nr:Putative NmrA-like domain, NAD(P)-binding domain superfamily [Colletotrichum destructivum]